MPEIRPYISLPEYAKQLGISHVAAFKRVQKGQIPAYKVGRNYVVPLVFRGQLAQQARESYFSIPQFAKKLGISRIAVYQKVKNGQISAKKVGRNYIIPVVQPPSKPVVEQRKVKIKIKPFLTIPQLAKELGISRGAVYKKVKTGAIKAEKIGRNFTIVAREVSAGEPGKKVQADTLSKTHSSIPQLAKKLGISRWALYRKMKKGEVKAVRTGRNFAVLIKKEESGGKQDDF